MQKIISRKEAIRKNLSFYFTGKPCKNGHICKRYTNHRNCTDCIKERALKQKKNNPKHYKQIHQKFAKENPTYMKDYRKKWNKKNKHKINEYMKNYNKEWRKTPLGQLRQICTLTAQNLSARKFKKSKLTLLSYTAQDLENHLLLGLPFASLAEARERGYEIDHILPLSYIAENIDNKELAFKIAMDIKNLQLLKKRDNIKKGNKIIPKKYKLTYNFLSKKYNFPNPLDFLES